MQVGNGRTRLEVGALSKSAREDSRCGGRMPSPEPASCRHTTRRAVSQNVHGRMMHEGCHDEPRSTLPAWNGQTRRATSRGAHGIPGPLADANLSAASQQAIGGASPTLRALVSAASHRCRGRNDTTPANQRRALRVSSEPLATSRPATWSVVTFGCGPRSVTPRVRRAGGLRAP